MANIKHNSESSPRSLVQIANAGCGLSPYSWDVKVRGLLDNSLDFGIIAIALQERKPGRVYK
jgi:hypothetical protein